jgi:DNA-binding NtrC family response regulator
MARPHATKKTRGVLSVSSRSVRPLSRARANPRPRRVLVVDDAEGIRSYLASLLELRGYLVDTAENGRRALELLESGAAPDVILLDVMMPELGGLETLRRIREAHPQLPVVMLSVVARATTIVEAMQAGAADYLNKPFEEDELDAVLRGALERRDLEEERSRLVRETADEDSIVWDGALMQRIRQMLAQISDTDVTVLIRGESGVGKEIVARAVHQQSSRAKRPFVKVNCAALPSDLLESELFGYERGAFTGAVAPSSWTRSAR